MEIRKLESGQVFTMAGLEWLVLEKDAEEDSVLVVTAESIRDMAFDENNSNDFRNSSLRHYLNGEFLEDLTDDIDHDNILLTDFDLTRSNGFNDYGYCRDRIGLLTQTQYEQFKDLLALDDWWWLISPSSGNSNYVRLVHTDGSLGNDTAYNGYFGVRPALRLEGDTKVVTTSSSKTLSDFTTIELLEELSARSNNNTL